MYCSQDIDFVFSPTVKELHPGSLDYLARYNIKKSEGPVTNAILNMKYSIGVSAFRLGTSVSFVIISYSYIYTYVHYSATVLYDTACTETSHVSLSK